MKHRVARFKRLWWPKRYDHSAWILMNILGRNKLMLLGWKREYPLWHKSYGLMYLDLAHPRLKLALEADGARWHMDVAREQARDEAIARKGWQVRHYRYDRLKKEPKRVKKEVWGWFWKHQLLNFRR